MLLCRSKCRILAFRLHRSYSTSRNPYASFQKLRAYPFAFDAQTAATYFAPYAAALCNKSILSSLIHRLVPWLSLSSEPIQPKRIVPLYFPAWIVDAEVKTKVRFSGSERTMTAQLQNGYVPGSDYEVLSSVPLWPEHLHHEEPVPWSEELLHQQGQEINCLPFVINPLSGLQGLSDLKFESFPTLHCSMHALESNLAVLRPILLPMYLAQYESENSEGGEHRACTLFMDASDTTGAIYAVRVPTGYRDDWDNTVDQVIKQMKFELSPNSDVIPFGIANEYVHVETVSISPPRDISRALKDWIQWKMYDPETVQKLAASSVVESDNDPRIREYDVEDRQQVEEWIEAGSELMMIRRILHRIEEQMNSIGEDASVPMRTSIEHLKSKEAELEGKRAELLPEWWSSYVDQETKP